MKTKNKDVSKYCSYICNMEYIGDGFSHVIARGKYLGLNFLVISNANCYPCAYVNVEKTNLNKKSFEEIPIECHGGLTFSNDLMYLTGETGWWIGWDYAHSSDKMLCIHNLKFSQEGIKYTTEKCVLECLNVIKQIKKLNKENK